MLSDSQIALVCSGRHGDPFSLLGIHPWQSGGCLRVLLPGASQVVALEAGSGELMAVLEQRHCDGLFEAEWPSGAARDYRLQIRWADGTSTIADDPYRFGPVLDEAELARHANGLLLRPSEVLGALPRVLDRVGGTAFAVWAPNASRVSVVGDFNHWDGRRHGMRLRAGYGVWEIFLPGVGLGAHYKFEIRSHAGRILPAKSDPYALQCEAPPGTNSISAALPPVVPAPSQAAGPANAAPMAIYEVHLGSWRRPAAPGRGRSPTWDELAEALAPYAAGLGFTHLKLLPIGEHPFDGSWGYQQIGPYAPTARFGAAAGFGRFVDRCHAAGLKVLIDWVPHHFPGDPHGLARFDGSRLYEGAEVDPAHAADWNTLGFDATRPQVRNYLVGNALFWLERYAVDGLRIADAPAGAADPAARALIDEVRRQVARLRPQALIVGGAGAGGGEGMAADTALHWDRAWTDALLRYMACDPARRLAAQNDLSAHAQRGVPVLLPLAHDRVLPEQGSLLARLPGTRPERFAQLRAFYAYMYAHPGRKLLFMGNEFAQTREWQHEQGLDWSLLDDAAHQGVQRLVGALNRLLRATPALHERDADPAGFAWIEPGDGRTPWLCFARRGRDEQALLIAACNFAGVPQLRVRLGVPRAGRYVECLTTDAADFGGASAAAPAAVDAQAVGAHGHADSIVVDLPAFSTVWFGWRP